MVTILPCYVQKKGKRKVQGVPQSQTAVHSRHQEEEETDKTKQAQIEQTYEKHQDNSQNNHFKAKSRSKFNVGHLSHLGHVRSVCTRYWLANFMLRSCFKSPAFGPVWITPMICITMTPRKAAWYHKSGFNISHQPRRNKIFKAIIKGLFECPNLGQYSPYQFTNW